MFWYPCWCGQSPSLETSRDSPKCSGIHAVWSITLTRDTQGQSQVFWYPCCVQSPSLDTSRDSPKFSGIQAVWSVTLTRDTQGQSQVFWYPCCVQSPSLDTSRDSPKYPGIMGCSEYDCDGTVLDMNEVVLLWFTAYLSFTI